MPGKRMDPRHLAVLVVCCFWLLVIVLGWGLFFFGDLPEDLASALRGLMLVVSWLLGGAMVLWLLATSARELPVRWFPKRGSSVSKSIDRSGKTFTNVL